MSEDQPERICGQRTNSGNYCQNAASECPYHDALQEVGADIVDLVEKAADHHSEGKHEYAAKYVRRAYNRL